MREYRFQRRLLIAAGALLAAELACAAPGGAPTDTAAPPVVTPTSAGEVTAAPTEPSTGEPCTPPAPDASIPDAASWQVYCDEVHGFAFRYPAGPAGNAPPFDANTTNLFLPFTAGTNLTEKYVGVTVLEGASVCQSPNAAGYAPGSLPGSTVSFNGIDFDKVSGSDAGAGQFRDFTAYSTLQGELCVSMTFVLHSVNPGNLPTPPPEFDKAAESTVFDQVMATFYFFTPTGGSAAIVPTVTGSPITSTDCNPPAPSGPNADLVGAIYCDTHYHFGFRYAPVGDSGYSGAGPLTLPILTEGTNLMDKNLTVTTSEGAATCTSPNAAGYAPGTVPSENVTINGVAFVKETGGEGAAGNSYQWVSYSTTKGSVCVNLTFLLHSVVAQNYPTPPAEFDPAAESAMFETIMSTFYFYGS